MVDDRVLARGVQRGRRVHQAVDVRPAVTRLHADRRRRLPAGGEQPRDVCLLERLDQATAGVAEHRHRWRVRRGVAVDEEAAVGRHGHHVIAVLRRQQLLPLAVEADAIEVVEVRIAAGFLAVAHEVDLAGLLVHAHDPLHVAAAARDTVLQLAGGQVVQVQVDPVVALRPPDQLVRRRQHPPQVLGHRRIADLRRHLLLEQRADGAGLRVGDTHPRRLVIARAGNKRHVGAVGVPLHVADLAAAGDVIGDRGAVEVWRHPEAHDVRRAAVAEVDDDAADVENSAVTGQRILPLLQLRRTDSGPHQVHVVHAARIVLERGELARIGRPGDHRPVAVRPAGVVGGVAEILDAVGGELHLAAGRQLGRPQVGVTDGDGPPAVGGDAHIASAARRRWPRVGRHAAVALQVAAPVASLDGDRDPAAVPRQVEVGEGQPVPLQLQPGGGAERGRQSGRVEDRLAGAARRVDQEVRRAGGCRGAVPEPAVVEPGQAGHRAGHQRRRRRAKELFGASVIVGRELSWLLGRQRRGEQQWSKTVQAHEFGSGREGESAHAGRKPYP